MGFGEVYNSLLELFPQIDARALRAVAIEKSKDIDAAVTAVLEDIIPFFFERQSRPSTRSTSGEFSEGDDRKTQSMIPEKSDENKVNMSADVNDTGEPIAFKDKTRADAPCMELSDDPDTEEAISGDNCTESIMKISSENTPCQTLGILPDGDMGIDQNMNLIQERKEKFGNNMGTDCSTPLNEENDREIAFADEINFFDATSSSTVSITPIGVQSVDEYNMHESNVDKLGANASTHTDSRMETVNIHGTGDVSISNATMSQSSQFLAIDVLEEVTANARNNKIKLFSAMESVISLMREVELKEESAEKAKEDAAKGGVHILNKVEELKQILQHANAANSMHSGEVYGEKAILASELRELQTRVFSLLDEGDKALEVLDEMNLTLKERLTAAHNGIYSAEQEKLEKEEAAQKSFADMELVMEKVVQESKTLKQAAEENSMLQDLLLDRGHAVDVIKGELAVICQDVRLLKEKFDNGVPFSKLTSFTLASSSSLTEALIPEQEEAMPDEDDAVLIQEWRDHEQVPKEEAPVDDCDALLEGWDILGEHENNA